MLSLVVCVVVLALTAEAAPSNTSCTNFCNMYMTNCSSLYNVYNSTQACFDECRRLPDSSICMDGFQGAALCGVGNSFGCRQYHLSVAVNDTPVGNLQIHCPHSTPSGANSIDPSTGISAWLMGPCTDSVNTSVGLKSANGLIGDYCNQIITTCAGWLTSTLANCMAVSQWIPGNMDLTYYPNATGTAQFPISSPPSPAGGYTLACKRYHAQAAVADPNTHCPHATTGEGVCGTDCEYFCDIVMNACTGSLQQYSNSSVCMSECAAFPVVARNPIPTSGNSLGCRTYHAMVASTSVANSMIHCVHASKLSSPGICAAAGGGGAAGLSASLVMVGILSMLALAW